jgi:hypothetical protein
MNVVEIGVSIGFIVCKEGFFFLCVLIRQCVQGNGFEFDFVRVVN